ncbi:uncharacterized protein LOC127243504 isoform X2 [Andrographis paniculata]|uniref:uncharacterized protein LOC127243504 isoform X2 n=1 Tax=Andrographis paniculata TaxID=175694 RepID=UPI0021E730F0|nr:uncharacterized protein LOC127243504 isoform X2 [Andrographis paniculata]
MVFLCFLLDLRSISPPNLRDLKQVLLHLANYYAIMFQDGDCTSAVAQSKTKFVHDRIGLCYIFRNRISCSDELKIAYNPHGNFNLRDLHHALNNLPTDVFCPESYDPGILYEKLADFLSGKSVYNWGDNDKSVSRKVILISSCCIGTMESTTMKALVDAGEKCVMVDFILLKQTSSLTGDNSENINHFAKQIASLKNCSFQTCFPNLHALYGLAKRWFLELKDDEEEPLQARFVFKATLFGALNWISCNLYSSFHPIPDEFISCQTCRCHGIPLDSSHMNQIISSSCPVNKNKLGALDIFENSIRVGKQTILHMPSFHNSSEQNQLSSPIEFNVICRTNLTSLSEGLIMGGTYFVTPSTSYGNASINKPELNNQVFQVVCNVLNSVDQGLVCYSNCNVETASVTSLRCYYLLLPSDGGLMLLRRLSASEEFLPIPVVSHLTSSVVAEEIENTVQSSLLKMEVSDYNPFHYERGFHRKLNLLVKESLQFGAIRPKGKEGATESSSSHQISNLQPTNQTTITTDELPRLDTNLGESESSPNSLAEEWEQLIVTELGGIRSPTSLSNSKQDQPITSPSQPSRQLDEKTSRILERLEVPRQLKRKTTSPILSSTSISSDHLCTSYKKPLTPYLVETGEQVAAPSQPMKPSFQRIKKKR